LTAYVPGEQPGSGEIIKLNTNENPYPPSPEVMKALSRLKAGSVRLYPDPECKRLRRRIGSLHACDMARVFVGNGSDEVLALCTRAFVENDGSIGFFQPSYSLYPALADIREVRQQRVPLGPGFEWPGSFDSNSSLFFLTRPNAPTGMAYPKKTVRAFCGKFEGVVVIDEAYAEFGRDHCMDIALELDNVLAVRTLSKSFSLAGLRAGYAVGAPLLIDALLKIKDSYNVGAVSQELALAAVSDTDHMRANVDRIMATRTRLAAALRGVGYLVCASEANFLWVKPAGIGAKELFERLSQVGILIRHFPGKRIGSYVRITIGTDLEIDKLIDAVARLSGKRSTP